MLLNTLIKLTLLGSMSFLVACGGSSSSKKESSSSSVSSTVETSVSSSSSSATTTSESSVSSTDSSSSSSSSSEAGVAIRAAKMEGFAAYAGVTGGKDGAVVTVTTGTELNAALCNRASMTTPIIIKVNGTINHGNTSAQGCNTQNDLIEIKSMSNVSIIGVGTNALFDQIGIHVRDADNIIIQNVHIRNVKKSGTPTSNGGDAIGMESGVDKVWIDHNWLEASGGESDGYDSLIDMKSGVTNVTVSYNLYNDSSRAGLVGYNDSDDKNGNITFHHNWYKNIEQRTPLARNALIHSYNNYWSNPTLDYMFHGINSRANAKVLVESNYFFNTNNPLIASDDSPTPGCWQTNNDNIVLPSIYYSRSVGDGALVVPEVIDGQLQSTCEVTVPYTVDMDAAIDVPAIVMANVGVGIIDPDNTSNSSASNSSSSTDNSSSSSSSSSSSLEMSSSSSSVNNIVNTLLPVQDNFDSVVDTAGFLSAEYKALATNSSAFYYANGGGEPSFSNGELTLLGGRFTIANTQPTLATTANDSASYGELDLSQPYRISFCLTAISGSGKLQVTVNNNTTSGSASIHGSNSRIYSVAGTSLSANTAVVIDSDVGNANSFIQIRTESSTSATIDNLWIGYQNALTSDPVCPSL